MHVGAKSLIAAHYQKKIIQSASTTALGRKDHFGSQYLFGQDHDLVSEGSDYFPTIEEPNYEYALQRPNQRGRSRLLDVGDKRGRYFDLRGVR